MDPTLPWINLPRQRHGLTPESFAFLEDLFPVIDESNGTRAQRVSGTWDANTTTLKLERAPVPTVAGGAELTSLPSLEVPLGWVDGKLRIEVGGVLLMKTDWPTKPGVGVGTTGGAANP
jgi:hypothetical protein